jgi:MFS family permease
MALPVPQRALAALSHRSFRIYIAGQAISLMGLWMQQIAHGWVVTRLTQSKTVIATVSLASSVPMVLLMLAGGVVSDRFERRKVLIVTQIALAALAFLYGGLVAGLLGDLKLAYIYAIAVGLGTVTAFDLPAQQALVPELVPPPAIASAVALNQSVFHGSRFLGPTIGALLMTWFSIPVMFYANGLSYLAVIVSLMVIRAHPAAGHHGGRGMSGPRALVDGLRYATTNRTVSTLLGFTALATAFVFTFLIVFIAIFVTESLGGDEQSLGVFMAGSGLGAASGALTVLAVRAAARGKVILVGAFLVGGMLAVVSRVEVIWLGVATVTLLSYLVALVMGLSNTIIQVTVPNELRGRVMSLYSLMFVGVMPLAALVLGAIADVMGLRDTLLLMAGVFVVSSVSWLIHAKIWTITPGHAE